MTTDEIVTALSALAAEQRALVLHNPTISRTLRVFL